MRRRKEVIGTPLVGLQTGEDDTAQTLLQRQPLLPGPSLQSNQDCIVQIANGDLCHVTPLFFMIGRHAPARENHTARVAILVINLF